MKGSYLGTEFNNDEIENELKSIGANVETLNYENMINKTAELLTKENAIGWFQGKMEFGPRALGCRSIIADPRSSEIQKKISQVIQLQVKRQF